MNIINLEDRKLFVPFSLQEDGSMRRTYEMPVCKTLEEARLELWSNSFSQLYPVEYREMTRSELRALDEELAKQRSPLS